MSIAPYKTFIVGLLLIFSILAGLLVIFYKENACIMTDYKICVGMSKEEIAQTRRIYLLQKAIDADSWAIE